MLETDGRRSALELELSAKGTTRLQAIVDAYAAAPWFDEVVFLAASASIAKRLAGAIANAPQPLALHAPARAPQTKVRVVGWPALGGNDQHAFAAAISAG